MACLYVDENFFLIYQLNLFLHEQRHKHFLYQICVYRWLLYNDMNNALF